MHKQTVVYQCKSMHIYLTHIITVVKKIQNPTFSLKKHTKLRLHLLRPLLRPLRFGRRGRQRCRLRCHLGFGRHLPRGRDLRWCLGLRRRGFGFRSCLSLTWGGKHRGPIQGVCSWLVGGVVLPMKNGKIPKKIKGPPPTKKVGINWVKESLLITQFY